MADELLLHLNTGWTSPYAFSVFVALTEKGLPFRTVEVDLRAGQHHLPEYQGASFTGRIPALRHGDFWLAESSAIDEYLEEAFPPPAHARLYPGDAQARARARMVQAFVRSDAMPVREERSTDTLFAGAAARPFTAAGQAAADRLVQVAGRFLPAGQPYLAGQAFGIADADLALMLQRLVHGGDPVPARLAEYAGRVFQRPSVRAWLAHTKWTDR
ncbi:MAG: glutathione transferase [Anaeromyxobacter sp.]